MKNRINSISIEMLNTLNSFSEGFLRLDLVHKITIANTALSNMFGYKSAEEMIGIPLQTLCSNPSKKDDLTHDLHKKEKLINYKLEFLHKDGSHFWTLCNFINSYDKDGHIIGIEGVIRDITEIHKTEESQKTTNQRLEATNQQLSATEQQLKAANQQLEAYNQQLINNQEEINKHAHDLTERVKELRCFYEISESVKTKDTIEEILQDVCNIIPSTWQYPDITRCKLKFEESEFVSQAFKESQWKQSSDIIIKGTVKGSIEVYYLKEKPELAEGPFLYEERKLLDGITKNISEAIERMKAEEGLQKSEEKFKILFENAPTMLGHINDKGEYLDINKAVSEITGHSKKTLTGGNSFSYIHADDQDKVIESFSDTKKSGSGVVTYRFKHKNGNYQTMVSTAIKIKKTNTYFICSVDITDKIQAEKQIIDSEDRFRKLIENMPNGVAIYKPIKNGEDFIFIDLNKEAEKITRSSKKQLIGKSLLQKFPNMIKSPLYANLKKINMYGKSIYIPPFYYKDEQRRGWRENHIYKLQTGEIVAIFTDVTELKDAEEKLKANNNKLLEAKEKAEESDRLKSAFLANMSHEIRTPMNGILGFTDLLTEPDLTGEERVRFIEIIRKSGDRMLNTVNDIIDISKIDAGQIEISKGDVNISENIETQVEFFKEEAAIKGIALTLANKLPQQCIIISDKVKLDSIISNLIKNAIKYTDTGTIDIQCSIKDQEMVFNITDTGIGISEERVNSIFNRFEQADIEDPHALEGSGLGLAITKAYVDMLGGEIGVESELGEGSTFYFTLPCFKK